MDFITNIDWNKLWDILTFHRDQPMIFSSGLFFILFLLFYPIYILIKDRSKLMIVYVVAFSIYFYYKSSDWCVILLLSSATSDYIIGIILNKQRKTCIKKLLVVLSIAINLSVLLYFKYFNLLGDLVFSSLSFLGVNGYETPWQTVDIVLPVGISFYTFQTMSYIIDLYKKEIKPVTKWIDYVFYVSFFPQLVAGPIVRAKDFIPQIYQPKVLTKSNFGRALFLITSGLIKKVIISDYISLNFVDRIFDNPLHYTGLETLLGTYGYSLQIYCDFSGYSDMAIGIALLLGFEFNMNFDSPYQSASITEFWRRWHISLSGWLKDYIYIPLGGSRKGKKQTYLNLMTTMLIGGLWHGAAIKFILWGGLHGIALVINKLWTKLVPSAKIMGYEMSWDRRILGQIITFHTVCFIFILFRADNMNTVYNIINNIFTNFHPEIFLQLINGYKLVFSLIAFGFVLHFISKKQEIRYQNFLSALPYPIQILYFMAVVFMVVQFRSADIQPFIYFQF